MIDLLLAYNFGVSAYGFITGAYIAAVVCLINFIVCLGVAYGRLCKVD